MGLLYPEGIVREVRIIQAFWVQALSARGGIELRLRLGQRLADYLRPGVVVVAVFAQIAAPGPCAAHALKQAEDMAADMV